MKALKQDTLVLQMEKDKEAQFQEEQRKQNYKKFMKIMEDQQKYRRTVLA